MNKEQWRAVKGYEGIYEINNFGEIKSLSRKISNGSGFYISKEKILIKAVSTTGYYKIKLCKNGVHKDHKIHRLVASSFIANPLNKPEVNHIDGNPKNNNVENLNWSTHRENMIHANVFGLRKKKLDAEQEKKVIRMYLSKTDHKVICKEFDISKTMIYEVLKRNNISIYSMSEQKIVFNISELELLEQLKHKSQKQLAKEIGCDASLISHYVKRIKENGGIYKC